MGKWIERAAQLQAEDIRDIRANRGANVPNVPIVPASLAPALASGLQKLKGMAAPRMEAPEVWPVIVGDALRLASDGWASHALALGWEPLHLWGVSPATGGIADLEGLAVWLDSRRILLLDAASCVVENGPGSRSIFNRRSREGAVLLWELGVVE
jgi:hypothetical protein